MHTFYMKNKPLQTLLPSQNHMFQVAPTLFWQFQEISFYQTQWLYRWCLWLHTEGGFHFQRALLATKFEVKKLLFLRLHVCLIPYSFRVLEFYDYKIVLRLELYSLLVIKQIMKKTVQSSTNTGLIFPVATVSKKL